MSPQEIQNFIKYQLERGQARVEIEKVLRLNQVPNEAIEAGFAAAGNPPILASAVATSPKAPSVSNPTPPNLPIIPTASTPKPSVPPAPPATPPPPPPPIPPVVATPPLPPASSHGGLWLFIIILILIAIGAGAFAYLKLKTPQLVTLEPLPEPTAPIATSTTPATPEGPAEWLAAFKTGLQGQTIVTYTFELVSTNASTTALGALALPARGSGTLAWNLGADGSVSGTLALQPDAASSTPLTLPFTLPSPTASSTPSTASTTSASILQFTSQHQLKLQSNELVLTLWFNS